MNYSSPEILCERVEALVDIDVEWFPVSVTTVFGQSIPLVDSDGEWVDEVVIEHIGFGISKFRWSCRFHQNDYIEWIIRSWIVDRIETRLDIRPNITVAMRIASLEVCNEDPREVEGALHAWLDALVTEGGLAGQEQLVSGARLLYRWGLEEGLPGFEELKLASLQWGSAFRNHRQLVAMRDVESGPYTRAELGLLEAELARSSKVTSRQRALFLLCRDWGFRPIQLALLRVEDYGEDELGPFLMVPSVKGIRRSRLRRASSNMVKRYIADDSAQAVRTQLADAHIQARDAQERMDRLVGDRACLAQPPLALFPAQCRSEDRLMRFCNDPAIYEYVLHSDSCQISRELAKLTYILGVPNHRALVGAEDTEGADPLYVTAYRLRRTKGTSLVLAGEPPEAVAEALDHEGVDSVKHYFRYSRDLHDFINATSAASPNIEEAVRLWSGRFEEDDQVEPGDTTVRSLGRCKRKSPCPHHPAVTCYSCHSFRPRKDADHAGALEDIEELQRRVSQCSTGPVPLQLEVEMHSARSLIIAIFAEDMGEA